MDFASIRQWILLSKMSLKQALVLNIIKSFYHCYDKFPWKLILEFI